MPSLNPLPLPVTPLKLPSLYDVQPLMITGETDFSRSQPSSEFWCASQLVNLFPELAPCLAANPSALPPVLSAFRLLWQLLTTLFFALLPMSSMPVLKLFCAMQDWMLHDEP